tara:strand:+ start:1422 stop:1718 length:297 start_codon:yes stop_codon:yes gene_type:complete
LDQACPHTKQARQASRIRRRSSASLARLLGHVIGRVRHEEICAFFALCAPLGAIFAAGAGFCARAGAPWVGFSTLQGPRDHRLGDLSPPIVWVTRFTS